MKSTLLLACGVALLTLALACADADSADAALAAPPAPQASGSYLVDAENVAALARGELAFDGIAYHCDFCEQVVTRDDDQAGPASGGIVWYGLWEDAIAEVERTGRPMLLHFGSPRVMQVCGVW